jgi:hypothetical protein
MTVQAGRITTVVASLLALATGCHQSAPDEAARLKTELEAVRTELVKAKAEAEEARAELARNRAQGEMKWAREVAEHFLNALATNAGEGVEARSVCTTEYAKRCWKPSTFLRWSIASHSLSPNRDEVSFRGRMEWYLNKQEFMLLVKRQDDGWKVDGFTLVRELEP